MHKVMYHLPESRYNELMDAEVELGHCKTILRELVRLKDSPKDDVSAIAKGIAWQTAREILKRLG